MRLSEASTNEHSPSSRPSLPSQCESEKKRSGPFTYQQYEQEDDSDDDWECEEDTHVDPADSIFGQEKEDPFEMKMKK